MPPISIVMPVYNAEKFLSAAIDSMLGQTFTDFEFLIIDDGSTDKGVAIIQTYADPRIRFYQNERNLGISQTLNKGIELAQSDLIARMDADDVSYPDRLQKQYDYLTLHPDCALVSSLVRLVSEDGQVIREDEFESKYFYYNLTFICWIYHPTVMYRRQAVREVGSYAVPYAEDFELFWQLSRRFKIYNLPEVLLDYRVTGQSLHQVLKKQEYHQAQMGQLLRNFRYYAGESYTLPEKYIECFQHNFTPLLEEQNVSSILGCLRELNYLSQKIVEKANINRDPAAIKEAASYKREFIISQLARKLPRHKAVLFLLRIGHIKFLFTLMTSHVLRKFA
ncbi:hypothetical protein BH24BAC1_BH24BAC1_09320 [soil metagenome]